MLNKYKVLVITFLALVLFGSNINSYPLKNWDEAWYAQISKNMAFKGTGLLMPFWNGDYYFDKPPLYFWLTTPIVRIFGAGEWQMRIVSVIAAVSATLALYFIAKKLFDEKTAFWSALIFLSFGQVIGRLGGGNLDGLLICIMLLAVLFYLHNKLFWTGVFVGLTALSKGIAFILYPLIIIGFLEFFVHKTVRLKLILIPVVTALVAGPWFLLGIINFGQKFLSVYLADPLSGNLTWRGEGFSPTLIITLLRDTGVFIIPSTVLILIFRNKVKKYIPVILILLTASILIFIPLNFFADKIGWYLLPIYPLLALFTGFAFSRVKKINSRWLIFCFAALALQLFMLIHINRQTPDRSVVSATLGRQIKDYNQNLGEVVLENNDFTSLLYYSDIPRARSLQKNTKPSEWWTINYDQFQEIIEGHNLITLITQNPHGWVEIGFRQKQSLSFGFSLLQNY